MDFTAEAKAKVTQISSYTWTVYTSVQFESTENTWTETFGASDSSKRDSTD